jgi:hypothetical protein
MEKLNGELPPCARLFRNNLAHVLEQDEGLAYQISTEFLAIAIEVFDRSRRSFSKRRASPIEEMTSVLVLVIMGIDQKTFENTGR